MKTWCSALLVATLDLWPAVSARCQIVTFDLDTGTPALVTGQATPFDQTAAGVTAHFSSPSGAAFSLQSDSSTGWKMSQFSGKYVYDNNLNRNVLDIKFSQPLTRITLAFATADFQQVEVPTTIQLIAYLDSTGTAAVGTATAHGTYASDTMPMGKLSFDSGGRPFNLVEIGILPGQALGAADFFVDNIIVTMTSLGNFASVSAASYAGGAALAPGAIASGFGQGLASGTAAAELQPLPTVLANTTVNVKDSAGVDRPAPLLYVAPTQINYLVPDGTATGPATVTVTSGTQVVARDFMNIDSVAPGLFTANLDGKGAPAAQAITVPPDLTQTIQAVAQCGATQGSCVTSPIDLGPSGTVVVLILYGTGMRGRGSLAGVTARIGGLDGQVLYAGAQTQYAGLDQVNVVIPRALAGQGEVDLTLTVDGKAANSVRVNIK
jgi:uncharacterized protein (TIGR03437 family)